MNATHYASPQLIAAARACSSELASTPRTEPLAKISVNLVKIGSANREERLTQAAHYFLSRHPEHTIAERLRFGRAHGFSHSEFRRAVRAARELSQQVASEADGSHTPRREGSTPSPATISRAAQIADSAAPCSDRGSGCGARETLSESSHKVWGNELATAPTILTASRSESQTSPASARVQTSECVTATEPVRAAV